MLGVLSIVRQAHRHAISLLSYLPDGTLVTGDAGGVLAHWDSYGCVWRERIARRAITAASTTGSSEMYLGSFDGSILLLDTARHAIERCARMRRGIASLAATGQRDSVIYTTFNGRLGLLRFGVPFFEERWKESRGAVFARTERAGGTMLLWGMGAVVQRRAWSSLEEIDHLKVNSLLVHDVFPMQGGLVATIDYDHRIATWLASGWVRLHERDSGVHGRIRFLRITEDRVWLSHQDGVSRVLLGEPDGARSIELPGALTACMNHDGTALAVGYRDGTVQIWTLDQESISKN